MVGNHFHIRVHAVDLVLGGFGLVNPHIPGVVNDLPLQVGKVHRIVINDAQLADTGGGQIHGCRSPKATGADDENRCLANFCLAQTAHLRKDDVAAVTLNLFFCKVHACVFDGGGRRYRDWPDPAAY